MNKLTLIISATLFASLANADVFTKEISFGSNNYDFNASVENKIDQFGKNVVEFTNPTINGVAIEISEAKIIQIKKQLCNKLGFKSADGLGTASQPNKFMLDLNQDGELSGRYENSTTTDMFRCLGSI